MAWSAGPGNLTSIAFGATTVDGGLIEGLSLATEQDTYDSAIGVTIERGSVRKTGTCNVYDVSAINAIDALMVGRTESTVVITYSDAATHTLSSCIIRVKPIIHPITDATRVYIGADGSVNDNIAGTWVDLGPTLELPAPTFDYIYQGTDGEGRPYFSGVKLDWDCVLPGTAAILPFTELTSGAQGSRKGVKSQVAVLLPDTNYLVFTDAYTFFNYADEDSNTPRAVRLRGSAAGAQWGDILGYSNGANPTSGSQAWDSAGVDYRSDMFSGMEVEFTGFHTSEGSLSAF